MEDELKAVEEIAKTARKAIDASSRLGSFLNKVLGDAFQELGQSLHDWTKYYRYKNLLAIQDKVERIHRQRAIEDKISPIPLRFAISLIESASLEDEETIQEMWSALIANSTDPTKTKSTRRVFINILSSLEPVDAKILNVLAKPSWRHYEGPRAGLDDVGYNLMELASHIQAEQEDVKISLENLARLGCIVNDITQNYPPHITTSFGNFVADPTTKYRLSPLANALMDICAK